MFAFVTTINEYGKAFIEGLVILFNKRTSELYCVDGTFFVPIS